MYSRESDIHEHISKEYIDPKNVSIQDEYYQKKYFKYKNKYMALRSNY